MSRPTYRRGQKQMPDSEFAELVKRVNRSDFKPSPGTDRISSPRGTHLFPEVDGTTEIQDKVFYGKGPISGPTTGLTDPTGHYGYNSALCGLNTEQDSLLYADIETVVEGDTTVRANAVRLDESGLYYFQQKMTWSWGQRTPRCQKISVRSATDTPGPGDPENPTGGGPLTPDDGAVNNNRNVQKFTPNDPVDPNPPPTEDGFIEVCMLGEKVLHSWFEVWSGGDTYDHSNTKQRMGYSGDVGVGFHNKASFGPSGNWGVQSPCAVSQAPYMYFKDFNHTQLQAWRDPGVDHLDQELFINVIAGPIWVYWKMFFRSNFYEIEGDQIGEDALSAKSGPGGFILDVIRIGDSI